MPNADRLYALIIDDHPIVSSGLRRTLIARGGFASVKEAGSAEIARRYLEGRTVDLAIVDLVLHDADGVELIRELVDTGAARRVVGFTAKPLERAAGRMLQAGAWAVVSKRAPVDVISDVFARASRARSVAALDLSGVDPEHAVVSRTSVSEPLSEREVQVLSLVASGLDEDHIADRLRLRKGAVKRHRSRIARKTGASDVPEMTRYAFDAGLVAGVE